MEINKIYNEDCLSGMQKIPDKSVDCIICDLPYGTTACKWDNVIPFEPLWEQYKRIRKDNAAIILFGSEPFSSYLRMSNIKEFKYDWIWEKTKASGFLNAKRKPLKIHETISVFSEKSHFYNPQGLIKGVFKTGRDANMEGKVYRQYNNCGVSEYGNYPKSVLHFSNPSGAGHLHPTQKPVDLIRYLIRTYSNPGDLILDNCMGSGSTAIAAMREGRNFIGFELESKYCDICLQRIEEEKDYVEEKKKEPKPNPLF